MEANLEEPLRLSEVARLVGVSQRHLERLFKRQLGESPNGYYLKVRLNSGRKILMQSRLSIWEISSACGFQTSSHFSKSYRMLFGNSPSTERALLLKALR